MDETAVTTGRLRALHMLAFGVVSGAIYTLSPLTVCSLGWIALVTKRATAGVTGHERRWVLAVLISATALRCGAIGILPLIKEAGAQRRALDAVIALQRGHGETAVVATTRYDEAPEASMQRWRGAYASYTGDAEYAIQRSIWIRNIYLGIPVAARDYIDAVEPVFGWSGYNYLLAFLHILFGPSPYGVALVSTAMFVTAAAMLYRVCRDVFGGIAALGGLAAVLFMPTLIAWSVMPLKESAQFLILSTSIVAVVGMIRGAWPVKIGSAFALTVALESADMLRSGGLAITAVGVGLGTIMWIGARRTRSAVALAVLMTVAVAAASQIPAVRTIVNTNVQTAAARQLAYVQTVGASFKSLDTRFYSIRLASERPEPLRLDFAEAVRFLFRSAIMFLTQPLPWAVESTKWLVLIPQLVVWYFALLLVAVGAIRGMWKQPLVTALLLGVIAAGVAVIAPNSGNIGTLIRHRDMIVPLVLMLAAYGLVAVIGRAAFDGRSFEQGVNL